MASGGLSIELEGMVETLQATRGLEADLARPTANAELRDAAKECARGLVDELRSAASSSGVPVAPRVARSIRVKRDRLPVVSIGGAYAVGRNGAPASALVWGSEQGPKGEVNHFGVPPSGGYWIAPAVNRFSRSSAIDAYRRAVGDVLRKWKLI